MCGVFFLPDIVCQMHRNYNGASTTTILYKTLKRTYVWWGQHGKVQITGSRAVTEGFLTTVVNVYRKGLHVTSRTSVSRKPMEFVQLFDLQHNTKLPAFRAGHTPTMSHSKRLLMQNFSKTVR